MDTQQVRFAVEQAGCQACCDRVRNALEPLITIETIEIDPAADRAKVSGRATRPLSSADVDAALAHASSGSGHVYRIEPGTWSPEASAAH